jgi:hypothetical protein
MHSSKRQQRDSSGPSPEALMEISSAEDMITRCGKWRKRAEELSAPWSSNERPGGINPDICTGGEMLINLDVFEKLVQIIRLNRDFRITGDVSHETKANQIVGELLTIRELDLYFDSISMPKRHPLRPRILVAPHPHLVANAPTGANTTDAARDFPDDHEQRRVVLNKDTGEDIKTIRGLKICGNRDALKMWATANPGRPISVAMNEDPTRTLQACSEITLGKIQPIIHEIISILEGVNPGTIERSLREARRGSA